MKKHSTPSLAFLLAAAAGLAITAHARAADPQAATAQQGAAPSTDQGNGQSLIARGQYLATLGDCAACHTAPGGKQFAGGVALDSPFGKIYPPNITPDKKNGIGDWSDDDFYHALHDGIRKDGKYLYPAFPFPWYTKVTRQDVLAIKAYLFSTPPVDQANKPLGFAFPFDIREGMLAWRTLFFKAGEFKPDPIKSEQWNRGAYLVEGLEHCGECHNKSNLMGASDWSGRLQGGQIEGWYAPALTENRQLGIGNWSESDLVTFMKTGAAPGKGVVLGPMAMTIHDSLSKVTDADLQAIAVYLKSVPATPQDQPAKAVDFKVAREEGGQVYLSHCAFCHMPDGRGQPGAIPNLAGDAAVRAKGPEDVIHVVLGGLSAAHGLAPMPAVGVEMTDQEVAEAVNYIRQSWGNEAPATADAGMVADIRAKTRTLLALSSPEDCKQIHDPAMAKAIDQQSVESALSSDGQPLLDRIDDIIGKVKSADPQASDDQIVNALTVAYCPVAMAEPSKTVVQKAADLGNFSGLVYGRLKRRPTSG